MTLRPREQDIKRERATSNICTNQGLMALSASVYMALMGKNGLRQVGELNYYKAHYAANEISRLDGYSVDMSKPFFNEFVVACPRPVSRDQRGAAGARASSAVMTWEQHYFHLDRPHVALRDRDERQRKKSTAWSRFWEGLG